MPRGCFIRCATLRQIAPFIREINIFVQAQQYFCLTTRHQSTLPGLSLIACAPRFIYVYFHLHTSSVCLSSSAKGIERTWLSLLLSLSYYFFVLSCYYVVVLIDVQKIKNEQRLDFVWLDRSHRKGRVHNSEERTDREENWDITRESKLYTTHELMITADRTSKTRAPNTLRVEG